MIRSTTIICIRHKGRVAIAGDGQVTLDKTILKSTAKKIRRLHNGQVLAGFAGATSDAFALFSRFEAKLDEFRGNLSRAAIELAKDWRMDKAFRRLEALLIDDKVRDMIMKKTSSDIIKDYAIKELHMMTLRDNAVENFINGVTSFEEVLRVTSED